MLTVPQGVGKYRICAIDPGTDTMGLAVLDVDLRTCGLDLVSAYTSSGLRMSRKAPDSFTIHGDRWTKLFMHEQNILHWLRTYQPHALICESPFLGRFPQAFESLVECKATIRRALTQYDAFMPLETIDPPSAKSAVGALVKKGSKDNVKESILKLTHLNNLTGAPMESFDEHTIDAIAVGYYKYTLVRKWLLGEV